MIADVIAFFAFGQSLGAVIWMSFLSRKVNRLEAEVESALSLIHI